jgi:dipeptidyl aminopeptidase/acylaminoacyl peptidase
VILSVDYRGSIGYGKEYEQATYMCIGDKELADVAEGVTYLRSLGFVDPEAIGVYGISYGGFLTLGAMAKYADRFALGINIAGIWDWEQYANWNLDTHPGRPWFGGFGRLGGRPGKHNTQAWFNASPYNFVAGLRGPILNLMGTADMNVDFHQMDRIIEDCVKYEKDFAVIYYPGEVHLFKHRRTWKDAFPRMERAFARYLKVSKEDRPPAMM